MVDFLFDDWKWWIIELKHDRGSSATRRTLGTGPVTERAAFLGPPGDRIFTVQHLPPQPRGAVLICSSVKIEFHANYNREVALARRLAEAGFAVGRFHYRGAGNSDGDDASYGSMIEDAEAAATALEEASGTRLSAVTGTRFGAAVSVPTAAGRGSLPLALWQPALDPLTYIQDILKKGRLATMRREPVRAREGAELEVLGYSYRTDVFENAAAALGDDPLDAARSCLIVELTSRGLPSGGYAAIAERLNRSGRDATVAAVKGFPQLWFLGPRRGLPDPDVSSIVVDWVSRQRAGAPSA